MIDTVLLINMATRVTLTPPKFRPGTYPESLTASFQRGVEGPYSSHTTPSRTASLPSILTVENLGI